MKIEVNNIWDFNLLEGVVKGKYRCLRLLSEIDSIIFFQLDSEMRQTRPIIVTLDNFISAFDSGDAKPSEFSLPSYVLLSDADLSDKAKQEVNERYDLIKDLIDDDLFYLELCSKQRTPLLTKYAKEKKASVHTLYRTLNKYWKYGQDRMALLSAHSAKGGKGKSRLANKIKRGAPVESKTGSVDLNAGINITLEHQEKIKKGLKKFYLKKSGERTLKQAYKKTLREYYPNEIDEAEVIGSYAEIPTYRQFIYWKKKLVEPENEIRSRTHESDYQKNKRALLGSVNQEAFLPGDCFEIDATVLDVHVVSALNRNKAIGRPTLYLVVDKASRMIVGLHVSMEFASWKAARQSLVNSFLPKAKYCKKFGVSIADAEWPCHHIPKKLLCDRGEMVCESPEDEIIPLMELGIAAPYRADMKGVVERRFKILNDELLHSLIGTTRGKHYVRGDSDPRQESMYTLDEITEMLIWEVLEHNRSMYSELATTNKLFIENDLYPSPINYWNIFLAKNRHSLKTAPETEIRAKLSPSVPASMTRNGIECNGMYYSCERLVNENWAAIARVDGRWKLEARIDRDNSSFIYVKFNDNEDFTRCEILPRSAMLKDLPLADIYYFQDWQKSKEQQNTITTQSVRAHQRKKEIEKESKALQKLAPKNKRKSEKISDMRSRRKQEILDDKNKKLEQKSLVNSFEDIRSNDTTSLIDKDMLSLLKRKKDSSK
jgi:hypothetical protein